MTMTLANNTERNEMTDRSTTCCHLSILRYNIFHFNFNSTLHLLVYNRICPILFVKSNSQRFIFIFNIIISSSYRIASQRRTFKISSQLIYFCITHNTRSDYQVIILRIQLCRYVTYPIQLQNDKQKKKFALFIYVTF